MYLLYIYYISMQLVEKHRIDDIKRREEREMQKLEKDAENYAKYLKTQRRVYLLYISIYIRYKENNITV